MMKTVKKWWLFSVTAVAMVMWLGSCDMIMELLGEGDFFGEEEGGTVAVSGVSLDKSSISMGIGGSVTLRPTITPANATNKAVSWKSGNTTVAAVDANGKVTGETTGTTTITVTTADGEKTAQASVTVTGLYTITNTTQWNNAFSAISSAADGTAASPMVYILNIQGEFDVAGRATASIAGAYKEVHLTGTGTVTVAESSTGCIIQTAANQTFIFDGPTLVGKLGNYRAVVYINGGRSEFRSGIIRDNYSRLEPFVENPYVGGGVFINSGTFEMSGGAISGNFTEYCGAGLLVYSGTFKMSGGEIKDNKAHLGCYGHGGGVFINSGGTFEMSGGTISGNIISSLVGGGGVYVGSTAVFNKTGGTIYGEDNASTTSHQSGSLANTNIYELFPGQNGHAVVFNKLYAPRIVSVIYRNNTLGPQDNFTTVGVTTSNLGGFEGYRIINLDE